jgi:hypothetical protein
MEKERLNLGHFYDGRKVNYIGKFEDEEMAARAADKYIVENKLDWLYCKLNFKEK